MKYLENTKDTLLAQLSREIMLDLETAIQIHGQAHILLSGGTTPKPLYELMNDEMDKLDQIEIGLIDERFVANDHPQSNLGLLRNCFKRKPNMVKGMVYHQENQENNLIYLKKEYQLFTERTDVGLLGMGTDGHFASIFPNDIDSQEALSTDIPFLNTNSPGEPKDRITCSLNFICSIKNLYLLISGKEKKAVLQNPNLNLPIHALLKRRSDINVFYFD